MATGLSTYAFFWRGSDRVAEPMSLEAMLEETATLGGDVFQICDYPAIEAFDAARLAQLRAQAERLGVTLELGTKGLGRDHLGRYLEIAERLGVSLLRSMVYAGDDRPTTEEATRRLEAMLPRLRDQGVTLALETYEQVSVDALMGVIERIDDPHIGVCLDPANCVAALESPESVIERTADRVVNLHIKDFHFTRAAGWVGFQLIGCPLGEGQLPFDAMMRRVDPASRGISQVIEHWLPWQSDAETTCRLESEWTRHNLNFLRSHSA
ncbi:sugar phosphate isomerase/epimerase family protein [Salinicola rhizosphaerae]|uniref:Sugar phosphate isomerase n=1 Tax=Salinicola rhizosphaerae TaxID=1443141 RepID=A0ABQ3DT72_9GAMM|nr:sugar phosphate isomerase/epimerase family protein [Salinicola rhizosphaerae]GHB13599.1 sugar phosphate isomerase [Salinicola rhizosphaerae]